MTIERDENEDSWAEETDRRLLRMTQEYLEWRLREVAPDSVLVQAWEKFYRIYDQILRNYAHARGVPHTDLEDCVQEVWRAVITELPKFQYDPNRGRFRTWLYGVVRHKAHDRIRRRTGPATANPNNTKKLVDAIDPRETDPAAINEHHWQQQVVQAVMAELREAVSETNYQVLHMRRILERSVAEVAQALGLTPKQVRERQHRAQKVFRLLYKLYTGSEFGGDSSP